MFWWLIVIEIVGGGDYLRFIIFDILYVVCCDFFNNVILFMCWVVCVYILSYKIKYSICICILNWYD